MLQVLYLQKDEKRLDKRTCRTYIVHMNDAHQTTGDKMQIKVTVLVRSRTNGYKVSRMTHEVSAKGTSKKAARRALNVFGAYRNNDDVKVIKVERV